MSYTKEDIKRAYELGVDDCANYCGYNTTVMQMIKPEKRKEFMEEYPKPEFKEIEEILKSL